MADRGTRLSCSSCRLSLFVSLYVVHLSLLPLIATVCSFDSFQSLHRHCHCPALALASKVTPGILVEKFGYLISYRGLPTHSLPLPFFFIPQSFLARAILSTSLSVPRHSCYESVHFSARERESEGGMTAISCRALYCSSRDNFTSGRRDLSRATVAKGGYSGNSENTFTYVILPLFAVERSKSSFQRFSDRREDYLFLVPQNSGK